MSIDMHPQILVGRPLTDAELVAAAARELPLGEDERKRYEKQARYLRGDAGDDEDEETQSFAPKEGVNPLDLASAGWGVIFAEGEDPEVVRALRPLLDWRQGQAGKLYKEFTYKLKPRPMSKADFLKDADGFGPVDPEKIPYYLLIVGSPDRIPFDFQYQVDVQYAVGRVHFDAVGDYGRYAEKVVAAERDGLMRPKKAAFFGVATPGDTTTEGSVRGLIDPMATFTLKTGRGWEIEKLTGEAATRARLTDVVKDAPALVMTATHGAEPAGEEDVAKKFAGALLCRDFPGPLNGATGPSSACFFAARDVADEARLQGSIFLLFACFGAGTPSKEDFFSESIGRKQLAERAFVSALPKRLLAGGALAVVGHIERAYSNSFAGGNGSEQLQTFQSTWQRLMNGTPVGFAMEYFNGRYAELSAELTGAMLKPEASKFGPPGSVEFLKKWAAMNDARNFCVIGDPAVRICVDEKTRKLVMKQAPALTAAAVDEAPDSEETPDLEELTRRLAALLEKPVEVTTHVGEGGPVAARTRAGLDGQVVNEIATEDEGLRRMHERAVERAMGERAELMRLVDEVLKRAQ